MKLSKKTAIFAAALFSLGGAAYTYDRYGVQDNTLTLENVEAQSSLLEDLLEWAYEGLDVLGDALIGPPIYATETENCVYYKVVSNGPGTPAHVYDTPGELVKCVNGSVLRECTAVPCYEKK